MPHKKTKAVHSAHQTLDNLCLCLDDKLEDLKVTKKKIVSAHSSQCTFHQAPLLTALKKWLFLPTQRAVFFSATSIYFQNIFAFNFDCCLVPAGGRDGDRNIQKCQSHPGKIWSWRKEKTCEFCFLAWRFIAGFYFLPNVLRMVFEM